MRLSRQDKEEQTLIAEKALARLRQEADRVAELEDGLRVTRRDLDLKSNEVEVAKMQIEQRCQLLQLLHRLQEVDLELFPG